MNKTIPIVIPAYEPDEGLITLCAQLNDVGIDNILVVDDGSGEDYAHIFETLKSHYHCNVLTHAVNLGKGRALKYAFNTLLVDKTITGCVTADSDGQHTVSDIIKCMQVLDESPDSLILGCRNFKSDHIPIKSKIGNELTVKIGNFLCGFEVSDTQTGLRGIPREFMKTCLSIDGERFEFEMNMLIATKNMVAIKEVTIETIYASKDNHQTHFDPVKDSFRIYLILGKVLFKYSFSSAVSCVIDLVLFALFMSIFEYLHLASKIIMATILARIVSTTFNYVVNYKLVFNSTAKHERSALKYLMLAVSVMTISAIVVAVIAHLVLSVSVIVIKILVDTILFFLSFHVQHKYLFTCYDKQALSH